MKNDREFKMDTSKGSKINGSHISIMATFIGIIVGLLVPASLLQEKIFLLSFILILAGIPHGASDFVIFKQLLGDVFSHKQQVLTFVIGYALIVILYSILWWLNPNIAFLFFVLNSIFHFGESNWNFLPKSSTRERGLIYWLWGATILGVPILLHFEEASEIIGNITGSAYLLSDSSRAALIFLLITSTLSMINYLYQEDLLDRDKYKKEMLNFCLLIALFFSAPLLIGFGIYFVFWHSLQAFEDQYDKLDLARKINLFRGYVWQILFFTLLAFGGLAFMYWVGMNKMGYSFNLAFLFIFIAIITVPHSLLMNQLYKLKSN